MSDSSQLRNPVNGILGLTGLLLETPLQPEQAEMVRLIHTAADEMLRLLGDSRLRLLLAEDDPANQEVDRVLLERLGHSVTPVANGEEALRALGEGAYQAVVLDCNMPVIDGYQVARRIRAGEVPRLPPNIPIVALTAHTGREARERCLAAGMDECLSKPLRPAEMAAFLSRVTGAPPAQLAQPVSAPKLQVLDAEQLQGMRAAPGKNGDSLLADFVRLFYRDEPGRIAELRAVAAKGHAAELARMAHTVAGSCAILGGRELQQAALAVERTAADGNWGALPPLLDAVDAAWERLQQALAAEGFARP